MGIASMCRTILCALTLRERDNSIDYFALEQRSQRKAALQVAEDGFRRPTSPASHELQAGSRAAALSSCPLTGPLDEPHVPMNAPLHPFGDPSNCCLSSPPLSPRHRPASEDQPIAPSLAFMISDHVRHIRETLVVHHLLPLPPLRILQGAQDLRSRPADAMAHVLGRAGMRPPG